MGMKTRLKRLEGSGCFSICQSWTDENVVVELDGPYHCLL